MALVDCDFFSESLEVGTSVTVVLPQATEAQIGVDADGADERGDAGPLPAARPLRRPHGLAALHLDRAVRRRRPVSRSSCRPWTAASTPTSGTATPTGPTSSEELPRVMGAFFRFSDRREDTFVAGLSMGGYGALKLALRHPDRFAAAASLSGAVDVAPTGRAAGAPRPVRPGLRRRAGTRRGPVRAARRAPTPPALPPLLRLVRHRGPAVPAQRAVRRRGHRGGRDVTTDFRPGEHEWGLWDAVIHDVIDWLPARWQSIRSPT